MHALLALALAAQLSAPGWETVADPQLGAELLRPARWTVEALANDALVVKAPPPLAGSVLLMPVSAPGASASALARTFAGKLGGTVAKETPGKSSHWLLLRFLDPSVPGVPKTALVAAATREGRALIAVLSAPSAEWDAARPALTAIAQSVRLTLPKQPVADAPALLKFEPFREAKEQAFVGELPGDWKKELTASIMAGANPYVRAAAIGRSADNLFSYLHYKLASFQLPVAELNSTGAGFRPYQPGAQALEKYLFPAVAQRSGQDFSQWKITRAGGLQSLFSHPSGVRFDGEAVDYAYRYKGEAFTGQAYVVTYFLPGTPTATWFLYALFGFEAPAGREDAARAATLRLLKSFAFEGRYAPQADLFWTLARDAGLKALAGAPAADAASIGRAPPAAAPSAVEAAALALTEVKETSSAKLLPVQAGIVAATQGAQAIGGDLLGDLRESP